jgi:hypothetical protein
MVGASPSTMVTNNNGDIMGMFYGMFYGISPTIYIYIIPFGVIKYGWLGHPQTKQRF